MQKRLLKLGGSSVTVDVESTRETQARLEKAQPGDKAYTVLLFDALDSLGVPDHPEEGESISDQELLERIGGSTCRLNTS